MIVLTIDTTDGVPIETYSINLAGQWKLGQKGKDNGALIVVAKNDRAYRLEIGYGLEGSLPDGFCGTVGRAYFAPYFKKGQYSEGVLLGVVVLVHKGCRAKQRNDYRHAEHVRRQKALRNPAESIPFAAALVCRCSLFYTVFNGRAGFLVALVGWTADYLWRFQGFGSGGFGGFGGFGGGGGGSFGGGGASGRW